jgi:L-lactate dehydrogenase complex protein LldG
MPLISLFTRHARGAGAQVTVVASEREAATAIRALVNGAVRCTAAVRIRYPELYQALGDAGHAVTVAVAEDAAAESPDRASLAATLAGGSGLIVARAGVAETGSLVLADDALAPRLLGMLADVCVALLPAETIVNTLDDAGELLARLEREGQRYVSLVTGPSRTADIERVLTIGVQGPKALHIVILQPESPLP